MCVGADGILIEVLLLIVLISFSSLKFAIMTDFSKNKHVKIITAKHAIKDVSSAINEVRVRRVCSNTILVFIKSTGYLLFFLFCLFVLSDKIAK